MFRARYTVEVYSATGVLIADLSGLQLSLNIDFKRNRSDQITMTFDTEKVKQHAITIGITFWDLFKVDVNEIRIMRNQKVISAGQINTVQPDANDKTTVRASGWFDLLKYRYSSAGASFTGTDAGEIAWNLIDTTQSLTNGNFGILRGVIQASISRDRTYDVEKNIYDAIVQLSEVIDGFDFEITWDKRFNVYSPGIGIIRDDIIFNYPGNIKRLRMTRDGTAVFNDVTIKGAGFGAEVFAAQAIDTTSGATYGLRQEILNQSDVSVEATLLEKANEELRVRKAPMDLVNITLDGNLSPVFGTYSLGDYIQVTTDDLSIFGVINGFMRLDGMDLSVDENNTEEVNLRMLR